MPEIKDKKGKGATAVAETETETPTAETTDGTDLLAAMESAAGPAPEVINAGGTGTPAEKPAKVKKARAEGSTTGRTHRMVKGNLIRLITATPKEPGTEAIAKLPPQAQACLNAIEANGGTVPVEELAALLEGKFVTRQPAVRVFTFYVNRFLSLGAIEFVAPVSTPVAAAAATA